MIEEKKVVVLMATYNGEKYIREQLDSILNQTYHNLLLIIRDDGSTDTTLEILEKYEKENTRVTVIKNQSDKHGAYINFWNLLHYAKENTDADYYFLSDQDDIWKLDKIKDSVIELQKNQTSMPLLLYSDMEVIGEKGEIIYPSYNHIIHISHMKPQATFFTRDIFWGCTMAFNNKLLMEIPLFSAEDSRARIMSHDTYLAEYAALFGKVIFLDCTTIGHRKHSGNVTGESALKYGGITIINKIFESGIRDKAKKHARTYAQSIIALDLFESNNFSNEESISIKKAIKKGGVIGCKSLHKYKIKKANLSRTILTYLIMLTGAYKKHMAFWINI